MNYYTETARTPIRFQQRVINQFNSPDNYEYLYSLFGKTLSGPIRNHALKTLWSDIQIFSAGDGPIYDFTDSDDIANRASLKFSLDLWSEIKRLNRIFYEYKLESLANGGFIRSAKPNIRGKDFRRTSVGVPIRDGISEDNESYAMRAFISDSLQPVGLEYLNGPGPNYEILENQSTWIRSMDVNPNTDWTKPNSKNNFSSKNKFSAKNNFSTEITSSDVNDDIPWSVGNPNRSAEQAIAEYWGDNHVSSDTIIGSTEFAGVTNGQLYASGPDWEKNGGSRFMRYPTIPFWQKGGREGVDYDIDETLGFGMADTGNHVRRWNMDKLTESKGQNYPMYGPRSGPVV